MCPRAVFQTLINVGESCSRHVQPLLVVALRPPHRPVVTPCPLVPATVVPQVIHLSEIACQERHIYNVQVENLIFQQNY
jgi:hypothetical protein